MSNITFGFLETEFFMENNGGKRIQNNNIEEKVADIRWGFDHMYNCIQLRLLDGALPLTNQAQLQENTDTPTNFSIII